MSSSPRRARLGLVTLLALTLVFGINGLEGAIHSVHHLSVPQAAHETDSHEDEQNGAPAEPCQVAAAASHTAAVAVEVLPVIGPSMAEAQLVPLGSKDRPDLEWREPARGRAPPFSLPLPR